MSEAGDRGAAASSLAALEGRRFPGGRRRIAHWENHLLTDCTGATPLADGLAHPIAAFNLSVLGTGISLQELFELTGAIDPGSVWLESYDWRYERPLREDVDYVMSGGIERVERGETRSGRPFDRVTFAIDIDEPDGRPAARLVNIWRIPQ